MTSRVERCYCLVRCADGYWLLLNRDYKPFLEGFTRNDWLDYDTCPGTRVQLTDRQLRRLEHGCRPYRPGDRQVWLYSDATNPNISATNPNISAKLCAAYMERFAVLDLREERAS